MKKSVWTFLFSIILALSLLGGCGAKETPANSNGVKESETVISTEKPQEGATQESAQTDTDKASGIESNWLSSKIKELGFENHKIIEVDGGDTSGYRQSLVAVDVGFGDREYWAFTNEHGQLIAVLAEKIILQDEANETLLGDGRYYPDEAKVPGTEQDDLDEGHVIADSLGGVANAYNITPQNSTLNRYGDQAYMEDWIRKANGASELVAIITYPDTNTQIPSHYSFTYILAGNVVNDEFDNINPEASKPSPETNTGGGAAEDISAIDTNKNGTVTIKEAKAAGFSMPIKSDHWLYKYMIDSDGDGMVGE